MLILFLKKMGNQEVTFYPKDIANIEISSRCGLPSGMVQLYDKENKHNVGVLSLYVHDTNYGLEPDFIVCSSIEAMKLIVEHYFPETEVDSENHFVNRAILGEESKNINRPSPFERNNIVVPEKEQSFEEFLGGI